MRGCYSVIKKGENMPFAGTWMDPETDILRKLRGKSNRSDDIPYMWHPRRNHTNEHIYKIDTDSQISRRNLRLPQGNKLERQEEEGTGGILGELAPTCTHGSI